MSEKKHKGDHGRRAEKHAAAQKQSALYSPATAHKPRRAYLRNWVYVWATLGVILAVTALIIGFGMMGWWDNLIGSILVVPVAAFGCMCVYDLALLLTACITFGEGMVNAGKNEQGQQMIFHASSVVRLEVRDKSDGSLPSDAPVYKNAELCFVMESGRINRRKVSRLTAKQLAKVKAALEAEKKFDTTQ
ncbi:MAG: hypothetical protein E7610_05815 [Ruminococcaceae bacterium]|nr:hypothetical protein [Oscillospiraceae bacterium]